MSHLKTIVCELGSYQKESCVIFAEFLVIFYSEVPKISFSSSKNTANSSVTKGLIYQWPTVLWHRSAAVSYPGTQCEFSSVAMIGLSQRECPLWSKAYRCAYQFLFKMCELSLLIWGGGSIDDHCRGDCCWGDCLIRGSIDDYCWDNHCWGNRCWGNHLIGGVNWQLLLRWSLLRQSL